MLLGTQDKDFFPSGSEREVSVYKRDGIRMF